MDQLTEILLSLFNLSTKNAESPTSDSVNRPILRLQHIDVILSRLVAALAPTRVAQFEQVRTLRAAEVGSRAAGPIDLGSMAALVSEAAVVLGSTAVDTTALQQVAQTVNDITLLDAAIRLNRFADVAIRINHADFFDYIAELRFQSPHINIHGHVIVVGNPNQSTLQIKGFTTPSILQKIDLNYTKTSPNPELIFDNLQVEFKGKGIVDRDHWIQDSTPETDLRVFTRRYAQPILQIETRTCQSTLSIALGALQITLPAFKHLKVITTSMIGLENSDTTTKPPWATYIRAY
jgi:hypothetical protein